MVRKIGNCMDSGTDSGTSAPTLSNEKGGDSDRRAKKDEVYTVREPIDVGEGEVELGAG